jgi:hypothetical protein
MLKRLRRRPASVHLLDCASCGGALRIVEGTLKCTQCGSTPDFAVPAGGKHADFAPLFAGRTGTRSFQAVNAHVCSECSAETGIVGDRKVEVCQFCGSTHLVVSRAPLGVYNADAAIPPRRELAEATGLMRRVVALAHARLPKSLAKDWPPSAIIKEIHRVAVPAYEFRPTFFTEGGAAAYESDGLFARASLYGFNMNWDRLVRAQQKLAHTAQPDLAPLALFAMQRSNRPPEKAWNNAAQRVERLRQRLAIDIRQSGQAGGEPELVDVGFRTLLLPFYVATLRLGSGWLIMDAAGGRLFLVPSTNRGTGPLYEHPGPERERAFVKRVVDVLCPPVIVFRARTERWLDLLLGAFIPLIVGAILVYLGLRAGVALFWLLGAACLFAALCLFTAALFLRKHELED